MIGIGLMSGTSLDGIDASLVSIDDNSYSLLAFIMIPFTSIVKEHILSCSKINESNVQKICSLNFEISYEYIKAIDELLQKANSTIEKVDFIAMHGQTIWHNPNNMDGYYSSTLQIGDPSVIAYHYNKTVISNFRTMDMAASGSGAPLMPYAHYFMYKNETKRIAIQNIGGIGNVTFIDNTSNNAIDSIIAFDTGPGNMLIDGAMKKLYNLDYDSNGEIAANGKILFPVIEYLMKDEYLSLPIPKSTGREKYSESYLDSIIELCYKYSNNKKDIITTISAYTGYTIIDQYQRFLPNIDKIILAGGGANNQYLVSFIKDRLNNVEVVKANNVDSLESIGFAIIGYATLKGIPTNIKQVTGAKDNVILGNITYPPIRK